LFFDKTDENTAMMTPAVQKLRFELVMLRDFFFPTTTKADAVAYWKAANRRRANLFTWDLNGFYRIGRRRIKKANATWREMKQALTEIGAA
jgi:hypothetical protein